MCLIMVTNSNSSNKILNYFVWYRALQVKRVRTKFKYDDISTNVGHIVAAEHNNYYPNATEIKLLVHPLLTGAMSAELRENNSKNSNDPNDTTTSNNLSSEDPGQISGYGPPVVFTCDSKYDLFDNNPFELSKFIQFRALTYTFPLISTNFS